MSIILIFVLYVSYLFLYLYSFFTTFFHDNIF